jgi:hypothetical protein
LGSSAKTSNPLYIKRFDFLFLPLENSKTVWFDALALHIAVNIHVGASYDNDIQSFVVAVCRNNLPPFVLHLNLFCLKYL